MPSLIELAAAGAINASDQLVINQGNSPTGDRRVTADKFAIVTSGAWTPALTVAGATAGTQTAAGVWVSLGNLVYCHARIDLSAKNANTGALSIESLPFAAAATTQYMFGVGWAAANVALIAATGLVDQTYRSSIFVYGLTAAGQILESRLNNTHIKTGTTLFVSGWFLR